MAQAYVHALVTVMGPDAVLGIYVKGSAYRPWDSLVDYVPELSDVDIHVRVGPDAFGDLSSLEVAIDVADCALTRFVDRVDDPAHIPRPQLQSLNELEEMPGYLGSPVGSLRTLFGEAYDGEDRDAYSDARASDVRRFMFDADFIRDELPSKVIDRPGAGFWKAISRITWRVGPAGPRLLSWSGMHPFDAWSLNRTSVIAALRERGLDMVAEAYGDFYLAGWDGFRSNFQDTDAARLALRSVDRLYAEGRALIESAP
jgi:hypothetical protein